MEALPPVGDDVPSCNLGQCFCRWRKFCSPRIPRVAPGMDYARIPALAVDRVLCSSLLIGFVSSSSTSADDSLLRLCRFRVARSGRVLGRSDDALEVLDDVDYKLAKGSIPAQICDAGFTPSPDGRSLSLSLCVVRKESAVQLHLDFSTDADGRRITVSRLPDLQLGPVRPTRPISTAGHLWAPYFTEHYGPSPLVMLHLDKESGQWVQVAAVDSPYCVLHGYAVVGDTILLSLKPKHLFFVFDCNTRAFTAVVITDTHISDYIPICGRGIYVEEDDTIYFLQDSIVFAYKLCQDQDQHQYWMAPPTFVDCFCPFHKEGRDFHEGFLTHLGSRLMCYVWISMPFCRAELHCNCDALHVLITTFRVKGYNGSNREPFVPKGAQILHSTFRRLDISSSKSSALDCTFCFLEGYEEFNYENAMPPSKKKRVSAMARSMLHQWMEFQASSNVVESSKMLTCCREFLNQTPFIHAVMLEGSAIQINKALYIICQVPSRSIVYEINILNGRLACHDKILTPHCVMKTFVCDDVDDLMEGPHPWHFVCANTSIYAVSSKKEEMYVCGLEWGTINLLHARRPFGDDFSIALVLQVGHKIIAISDTLGGVYHLSDTHEWERRCIRGSADLERKVDLCGHVVLSDESFMVYDAETRCCFLFDLDKDTWTACSSILGYLIGRCVFTEGFIYTCVDGGLAAFEGTELEDSYRLGDRIDLKFPWHKWWLKEIMCFDYVGIDRASGAIMFCVVQGNNYYLRPGASYNHHPVLITTIQVKTERIANGKLKPVAIGHVDVGTSLVERSGGCIRTRACFAVAPP